MSWRTVTVGSIVDAGAADIQTGPFGTQLKASDYVDEGTPVINVRNIGFGELKPEKLEFVTEKRPNDWPPISLNHTTLCSAAKEQ